MDDIVVKMIVQYGTVAVPLGYLGMLIARGGYYKFDDNMSRLFVILIFSSIAYYCNEIPKKIFFDTNWFWLLSFIITILIAVLWRICLMEKYFHIANKYSVTNENTKGNTLNSIIHNTKIYINAIVIYTQDGKGYQCYDLAKFYEKFGFGLLIDETGVGMPVTHIRRALEGEFEEVPCELGNEEILYTYIPTSEIKLYDFAIRKK